YSFLDIRDHTRLSRTALFSQTVARLPASSPFGLVLSVYNAFKALAYVRRWALRPQRVVVNNNTSLEARFVELLADMPFIRDLTAFFTQPNPPYNPQVPIYASLASLTAMTRLHIKGYLNAALPFGSFCSLTDLTLDLPSIVALEQIANSNVPCQLV